MKFNNTDPPPPRNMIRESESHPLSRLVLTVRSSHLVELLSAFDFLQSFQGLRLFLAKNVSNLLER